MSVFKDHKISLKQVLEFIPEALLTHLSATTKVDYYSKVLHGKKMFYLLLFCIFDNEKLLKWFQEEFPKYSKKKLDMGKSCMRFKKPEDIPYELIGELASKITPEQWIQRYESAFLKK